MTVQRSLTDKGLRYRSDTEVAQIAAERSAVEHRLGHVICGHYLGNRDGQPNVCWLSRGHSGRHL